MEVVLVMLMILVVAGEIWISKGVIIVVALGMCSTTVGNYMGNLLGLLI